MEAFEVLQFIALFILSVAGLLFIIFLSFGIFLIVQIRRYLKRAAAGVEHMASNIDGHLKGSVSALLKYPLIGFIIKRLFRKFF